MNPIEEQDGFKIYDASGKAGTFKRCRMDVQRPAISQTATLGAWLLWLPGWSPAWEYFILSVVHLRPIPGDDKQAVLKFPEATHELILAAIDPEHPADWRDIFGEGKCNFLTPLNVVEQFTVETDKQAVKATEIIACACVSGMLPIELQGISGARDLWKDSIAKAAAFRGIGLRDMNFNLDFYREESLPDGGF